MLPGNLHFKASALDDANAGGLSPVLRNPGRQTHRYHRDGEKWLLQDMVKLSKEKPFCLLKTTYFSYLGNHLKINVNFPNSVKGGILI